MTTPVQQSPYLRQQRNFPSDDAEELSVQLDRAYIDIASQVNARTIGLYAVNTPVVNGEQWFLEGQVKKQQTLRKLFSISSAAAFNHGIDFSTVSTFTVIRGIGYDGTNYYPIPYVSPVAAADSMGIFVNSTQVQLLTGAGSPAVVSAVIILEWLSQF